MWRRQVAPGHFSPDGNHFLRAQRHGARFRQLWARQKSISRDFSWSRSQCGMICFGVLMSLGISNQMGTGVFRTVLCCALLSGAMSISVAAENAPGVTDTE